jgi:cytochrome c2
MYGTTVAIELETGAWRTFTSGHRNPQGLLAESGRLWSTEHGPHGGDELNLLVEGRDYGWPRSTYGTEYGKKEWPFAGKDDPHDDGVKPVFSWVPSVGISNLIRIRGELFSAWRGDLLVGSITGLGNGYSVFRVHLDDTRVILVERIQTGRSVRDLLELDDGRILLWDGGTTLQTVEPAAHVFAPCSGCHALRWDSHGIGPDLMGVVDDRVARFQEFPYSEALRALGGRWTPARLDEYLSDPAAFAPGTTMDFPGIADPSQRAMVIEYLDEIGLPFVSEPR